MILTNQQIAQIIEIAQNAGAVILEVYQSKFKVDLKADKSPVTLADKLASKLIIKGLQEILPNIPAISEEEVIPHFERKKCSTSRRGFYF